MGASESDLLIRMQSAAKSKHYSVGEFIHALVLPKAFRQK